VPDKPAVTVARGRFESARHIDVLPEGHRSRRMHGHGFVAGVFTDMSGRKPSYRGGEVPFLQKRLDGCLEELTYKVLNDVMALPDDGNLARWLRDRLGLQGPTRVAVQSTPDQGVELDGRNRMHIWRRYRFFAAHRLPHVPTGHKCGRMHGHGFQAVLYANHDPGDPASDIGYDRLDGLWAPLAESLNHRCLNDIPGLSNPTSEMISSWLWDKLKPGFPLLARVAVYETESCGACFDGAGYRIWKDFTIDSAVRHGDAPEDDPRRALHGDTFLLRLHLDAPLDRLKGWTVDFGDVKAIFDPFFKDLDHQPLYERSEFRTGDTASIARWIHQRIQADLPQVARVDAFGSRGGGTLVGDDLEGPALPA